MKLEPCKSRHRPWATSVDLQLPTGWKTNLLANLTAGALYYADMSDKYNIPATQAAAAYNGSPNPNRYTGAQAQRYQTAFNQRQVMMMNLVNCMR